MLLTCSGQWDPQQVAGPRAWLPLSQAGVRSSWFPHWEALGPSYMGRGDPWARPQTLAALGDSTPLHGEGNGGQGGRSRLLEEKNNFSAVWECL